MWFEDAARRATTGERGHADVAAEAEAEAEAEANEDLFAAAFHLRRLPERKDLDDRAAVEARLAAAERVLAEDADPVEVFSEWAAPR
ncbi:hypothetical protein [Alienimonas chondri]|uniref:Uncharacterized protein n=1 Tax=Alienimonas chondri TaxID=2681879 RepID=A0ABX1VEB9_9PLAN|nr:hypothetical protein [Alienimonas chondri]NNJ26235.1 hypothetical protein [Alienimonas chondri]